MKRVRKANAKHLGYYDRNIKYLVTSEYGPESYRAHYHGLIFNLQKKTINKLAEHWKKGWFSATPVTPKRIRYVCNYMALKSIPVQRGQKEPFMLVSKGYGMEYIQKHNQAWHKMTMDQRAALPMKKDKRPNLPRYLVNKIYTDVEKEILKERRIKQYQEFLDKKCLEAIEKNPNEHPLVTIKEENKRIADIKIKRMTKKRKL